MRRRQPPSDALGFDHPPARASPIGDHRNGTPTSLNPSAPRHARSAAASFTCRLHGSRLARPPVLARLGTWGGNRSAPGWYVAAPSERRSNTAWRDECRHQAMLVLKGSAGTASPHNKPVRSAFPQSDQQTALHRQPPERHGFFRNCPSLIQYQHTSRCGLRKCGMRNQGQPHDRLWSLRPKGAKHTSPRAK